MKKVAFFSSYVASVVYHNFMSLYQGISFFSKFVSYIDINHINHYLKYNIIIYNKSILAVCTGS